MCKRAAHNLKIDHCKETGIPIAESALWVIANSSTSSTPGIVPSPP